jgi:AcrR family transcriptional regulator
MRTSSQVAATSSRDRIREAAKSLFAKHGYESTSTMAICRQAGTSESQLLKHFSSKQGALEAIFQDAWEHINPALRLALDTIPSAQERFKMLIEMVLNFLEKDPELRLLFLLEGRRIRDDGKFVVLVPGFLEFVAMIDTVLKQIKEAGELVSGVEPQAVRSGLMGAVEGLMRDQLIARSTKFPAHYSSESIRVLCFRFLGSVLQEPGRAEEAAAFSRAR